MTLLLAVFAAALAGCAAFTPLPEPTTLDKRLAAFPTKGLALAKPVAIHWDAHQIPFIEAETDGDLAFALGLVHAHLRLGQMELMRRLAQGRVAEMGGPLAIDIDRSLRIADFGRAAPEMEKILPDETRAFLRRYVEGINHYLFAASELPHEFAVLGLKREAWTVLDVLSMERLGAADVNWLIWFNLLRMRGTPGWADSWARLVRHGTAGPVSMGADETAGLLQDIIEGYGRTGSNSVVVSGARTATGAAMIASDPHLGINLPNVWLIGGIKSPSFHAAGLMFPGLPFVAVGRNESIAWGGTNMRAAASDLVDVSKLPLTERTVKLDVRWWFDAEAKIRESELGPVISDAPVLSGTGGPYALKWVGHAASDEITAMLKVNRARSFEEYRAAFKTFAVPAQNMMYADTQGNIGELMAVHLPIRPAGVPPDLVRDPADPSSAWLRIADATQLPFSYNPARGWLGSANNKPAETPFPIGYFFSPGDRVERMKMLLGGEKRIGVAELEKLQQDVYMTSAVALRDAIVAAIDELNIADIDGVVARMRAWDGSYTKESSGAVAFEVLFHHFKDAMYEGAMDPEEARNFISVADAKLILVEDVRNADKPRLSAALEKAIRLAAPDAAKFASWGEMHRLGLSHVLGNIPVIGSRYRFGEFAVGGSTDTLMKTSAASSNERHRVRYGSQARHVSDLSDLDSNWFLLLGGQDGWLASSTFMDQVDDWLAGRYIQVPMRAETVRTQFPHAMTLTP
jgi:penicillin amidase